MKGFSGFILHAKRSSFILALLRPFAEQRGFAKARWSRDQGQFVPCPPARVQPLNQPGTENNFRPRRRDIKLGRQYGNGHASIIGQP